MFKKILVLVALVSISGCSKKNTTEPSIPDTNGIYGTWNLVTVKVNNVPASIYELADLESKLIFKSFGIGQVWFMDNGVLENNMPMNFTWTTGPNNSLVITVDNNREILISTYVLSDSLTITYNVGQAVATHIYSRG